jgi:hypothetical protein
MLTFLAKITVKSGREDEFERTMRAAVPKVHAESGNHAYIFHRRIRVCSCSMSSTRIGRRSTPIARTWGIDLTSFLDGAIVREVYDLA